MKFGLRCKHPSMHKSTHRLINNTLIYWPYFAISTKHDLFSIQLELKSEKKQMSIHFDVVLILIFAQNFSPSRCLYRVTQKERSSPKIEQLPKFYLDWHKTSATSGQACVTDISKVSSLYYKNSLFRWRSKNVLQMSSPALQAHLGPVGKVLDDPPAFLPWDRSYFCCDCCF